MRKFILISLLTLLLSAPYLAAGIYSGGTGDPNSPYLIGSADDIIEMSSTPDDWNKNFLMIADVNMIDCKFAIAPIASDKDGTDYYFDGIPFTGVFDGAGYKILNLTIDTDGTGNDHLGLFGQIEEGIITRLGLKNISITGGNGSRCLGGLCGYNRFGSFRDCYVTGILSGGNSSQSLGGLCGGNWNVNTSNCQTSVLVTGGDNSSCLGGLLGYNWLGSIINCCATGDVSSSNDSIELGGLCGYSSHEYSIISNCFSTGHVTGDSRLGGLCGRNGATISNCYSTGNVINTNGSATGGFCGSNSGTIEYCYTTGIVTGEVWIGGFCGENSSGTINYCYALGSVNGYMVLGGLCGFNKNYGIISHSYAKGSLTGADYIGGLCGINDSSIANCYAIGHLDYDYESVYYGGLCGDNRTNDVSDCFWDTLTSGIADPEAGHPDTDGMIGLTTTQMQTQSSFTDYGWDFVGEDLNGNEDYWRMCVDGIDYPKLWWQYSKLGDFDCPDGVGLEDILAMVNSWLQTGLEPLQSPDADGDGKVDINDFAIAAENYLAGN